MGKKKLGDPEMDALWRGFPGNAKAARAKLLQHLDGGGPLDPDDYALLLSTYVKWDRRGWPGALLDKRADPRRDALVDELLAMVRPPAGKTFVASLGALSGKRRASLRILWVLPEVLVALGRLREAIEMFEIYRVAQRGMRVSTLMIYVRAAAKLGERAPLERALRAFDADLDDDPGESPFEEEVANYRALLKKLPKGATSTQAPTSTSTSTDPTTPVEKIADLVARLEQAGGKARGYDGARYQRPKPLAKPQLARLRLPNGKPVAPSLASWLAFDASWLPLLDKNGQWKTQTLAAFFRAEAEELELDDDLLDVIPCLLPPGLKKTSLVAVLPDSASQRHLLVLDKPARNGELPVLGYEKEELWVKYPTFADFARHYFGIA